VKKLLFLLAAVCFFGKSLFAQDVDLQKIVVTPYRYAEELSKIPSSTSVVSQKEIENANNENVVDALRQVPGVSVHDFYGNGVKACVDIRGFGELAPMNVLVLIDGRRVNEIDLSAVSWDQIPLNQVEKIEILRGGAGSVLYGDNAANGVINIITKRGSGKPQLEFETEVGSYNRNRQVLSVSGSKNDFSYWVTGSHDNSKGYRKNSYYKAKDFATRFSYEFDPNLYLSFSNSFHSSAFGLPGALKDSQLKTRNRTDTVFPNDHVHDKDYNFSLNAEKKFGKFGNFDMGFSFRDREVYSHLGSFNPVYKSRIKMLGITPKYILDKNVFSFANKLITGLDFYCSDYSLGNYNDSETIQSTSEITKTSLGYYFQDELSVLKNLIAAGGYRWEQAKYEFNFRDLSGFGFTPDIDQNLKPTEWAYNGGLSYKYQPNSRFFFNINHSFRFPAVDEYFSVFATPPINTSLRPQDILSYEAGIKHNFKDRLECDLSLFRMNVENELFFNPLTFANENYLKTRHEGVELAFNSGIFKYAEVFGSYTFTKAFFRGGVYDRKKIPMVAPHRGSLGFRFSLPKNWKLNLQMHYTGKRYFINDQANRFSPANGYFTADMNISCKYKELEAIFGINNLFDKQYSEFVVYSIMYAEKAYYPSPRRNFYLKLKYTF
jgi:iron complex outermembrane receptor protein